MTRYTLKLERWLGAVVVAAAVAAATPAGAQEAMPLYVSEQFKAVARKAFRQLLGAQIRSACPDDKLLCPIIVDRLAQAFDAVLSNDELELKEALSGLFADSAIAALLHFGVAELLDDAQSARTQAVKKLAGCLSAAVAGRPSREVCTLGAKVMKPLLAIDPPDCSAPGRQEHWCRLSDALADARPVGASDALRVLADVASSDAVGRVDVRIYLLRLAALADHGVEDGLFDAALAFLLETPTPFAVKSLVAYTPGASAFDIFEAAKVGSCRADTDCGSSGSCLGSVCQDKWREALRTCGYDAKAYDAWTAARDDKKAPLLSEVRRRYLSGEVPETGPLDAVLRAYPACPKADAAAATTLRLFRDHVRYAVTPVKVQAVYERAAVPALLGAALLDYVRTRDASSLQAGVRKSLVYAAAQAAALALTLESLEGEKPGEALAVTFETHQTPATVLRSCEGRHAAALLGVQLVKVDTADCLKVATGAKGTAATLAPVGAMPDGAALAAHGKELKEAFDALLRAAKQPPRGSQAWARLDAPSLSRAAAALAEGRSAAAERNLLRLGVDFLAEKLAEMTGTLVGGEETACLEGSKVASIFKPADAGCAAHLLLKSAYKPIADYFWQGGFSEDGTKKLASGTYRALLASPGIDRSPIILNLGLGASWVNGAASVWGAHGSTALTVLDKFGLAIVKLNGVSSRFEVGVFVGGFLDALVRTATQEGKEQRAWLAGLTAGWTRVGGVDVGVELHVAAAMPFDLSQTEHYGTAVGVAVVIPYTLYFEGD